MRLLRNSFANFKSVKKISAVMFLIVFHRFFDNCSPIFAHKPPEGGGVAGSLPVYGTPLKIYTVLSQPREILLCHIYLVLKAITDKRSIYREMESVGHQYKQMLNVHIFTYTSQ